MLLLCPSDIEETSCREFLSYEDHVQISFLGSFFYLCE